MQIAIVIVLLVVAVVLFFFVGKRRAGKCRSMGKKNPILDKGDLVTILAQRNNIRITVPGRIMEKGYAGEMIKVQNTMSSKEIFARVMDHSTVIVDF